MKHDVFGLARSYPLPFIALAGLAAGGLLTLGPGQYPAAGRLVWYVVLVVGGAPVIYQTRRG